MGTLPCKVKLKKEEQINHQPRKMLHSKDDKDSMSNEMKGKEDFPALNIV